MKKIGSGIMGAVGVIFIFAGYISGIASYFWSLYIAFKHGFIPMLLTMFMPVFSQLYWAYKEWDRYGFDSNYVKLNAVFVISFCVYYLFMIFKKDK